MWKRRIFDLLGFIWIMALFVTAVASSFNNVCVCGSIVFILMFYYINFDSIRPKVNWSDQFDSSTAIIANAWFGTLFNFVLACCYDFLTDTNLSDASQCYCLCWILCWILGLLAILVCQRDNLGKWKWGIYAALLLFVWIFISGILGFVFHIYL